MCSFSQKGLSNSYHRQVYFGIGGLIMVVGWVNRDSQFFTQGQSYKMQPQTAAVKKLN